MSFVVLTEITLTAVSGNHYLINLGTNVMEIEGFLLLVFFRVFDGTNVL